MYIIDSNKTCLPCQWIYGQGVRIGGFSPTLPLGVEATLERNAYMGAAWCWGLTLPWMVRKLDIPSGSPKNCTIKTHFRQISASFTTLLEPTPAGDRAHTHGVRECQFMPFTTPRNHNCIQIKKFLCKNAFFAK